MKLLQELHVLVERLTVKLINVVYPSDMYVSWRKIAMQHTCMSMFVIYMQLAKWIKKHRRDKPMFSYWLYCCLLLLVMDRPRQII